MQKTQKKMIKLMTCAPWFHKYAWETSDLLLAVKMLVNQQEREEEQIFFFGLEFSLILKY